MLETGHLFIFIAFFLMPDLTQGATLANCHLPLSSLSVLSLIFT